MSHVEVREWRIDQATHLVVDRGRRIGRPVQLDHDVARTGAQIQLKCSAVHRSTFTADHSDPGSLEQISWPLR